MRPMSITDARQRAAQVTWAALAVGGLAAAFLVAFVVVTTLGSWGVVPTTSLRLDLAAWLVLTGLLAMAAVTGAARLAFGDWPLVRARTLAWAALGLGIAVGVELALHEWARITIGLYDAEYVGLTAGLSFTLVGLAVASFGVGIAPLGAATLPSAGVWFGALVVAAVTLSNLPGLADGIGPKAWPLAVGVGASVLYAAACAAGTLRRGLIG